MVDSPALPGWRDLVNLLNGIVSLHFTNVLTATLQNQAQIRALPHQCKIGFYCQSIASTVDHLGTSSPCVSCIPNERYHRSLKAQKKVSIGPTLHEQRPVDLVTDQTNSILFKVTNGYRDMTKPGMPLYPVMTYFLPAPPAGIPPRSAIAASPLTERVVHNLDLEPVLVLNPQTSGWLIINQESLAGEQALKVGTLSGTGVNRFLEAAPNIYYLGVGSEIDVNQLRQNLGVLGQQTLPIMGTQHIRITAALSKV